MGEQDAMLFGIPKTAVGKEKAVDSKSQGKAKAQMLWTCQKTYWDLSTMFYYIFGFRKKKTLIFNSLSFLQRT